MSGKIVIFVILGLIIIAIILAVLSNLQKPQLLPRPTPTPTSESTRPLAPTIPPLPTVAPEPQKPFQVLKTVPENNLNIKHLPVKQIAFYFSQDVNTSDIQFTTSPETRTEIFNEEGYSNVVIISPYFAWEPGITTITITTNSKSETGVNLEQPHVYKLFTGPLDNPGL